MYKFVVGGGVHLCQRSDRLNGGSTERGVGEEQCNFKRDGSRSDLNFVVRQLCEKMEEKNEVAFIDVHGRRETICQSRTERPCGD